jgi:type I restriction enzyme, S subunit
LVYNYIPYGIIDMENSFEQSSDLVWPVKKIVDFASTTSGGTPSRENLNYYLGDIPWVKSGELKDGIILTTEEKITNEATRKSNAKIFPKNTVLIAMYGATTGRVGKLGIDAATNQAVCAIFPNDTVMQDFLLYALMYKRTSILKERYGGAQPNISQTILREIEIPVPPLAEQKDIVRVLTKVREAIEAAEKVIAATKELKKSMMKHLFTYGPVAVHEVGNVQLRDTEIGPIPEGWEVKKLKEVSAIRYGLGQPPDLDLNGISMIRATDINRGSIDPKGVLKVKKEAIPVNRNPFLKDGDIIVVRSGAYTGDVAQITKIWEGSIAGYDLVVTCDKSKTSPNYCAQFLLGPCAQEYFYSQRARSAQPHINSNELGNTKIPVPSLSEQINIARVLEVIDRKLINENANKRIHERFFHAILPILMSGEIRVV